MARKFQILLLGFVLALVGSACGSSDDKTTAGPDVSALAPADNEISGWVGDPMNGFNGVTQIVRTYAAAVQLIDGSADPFFQESTGKVTAKGLAYNKYAKTGTTLTIDHRAWQLASAADCATVYADLMNYGQYSGQQWSPIALGDQARIALAVVARVNVCKGAYLIETALSNSTAADLGQAELLAFVNPVLAKIP